MKSHYQFLPLALAVIAISACESKEKAPPKNPEKEAAVLKDIPILPVKKGDFWIYNVQLDIPAGISSPGAAEVEESHKRTRTYIGKISPAEGLAEVDCFEVTVPKSPVEREFVEIYDDRVLMRGSMIMRPETTKPMWLDRPIPFVIAGMKAGTELPELEAVGGGLSRKTQIVARETIKVPAGSFPSIRILMTGKDGEFELRRTIWFSPGTGIIREEKTRYLRDKVIFHENQELVETNVERP